MRVSLAIEGGLASFPGLRKAASVDVDRLPAHERDALCALVDAADVFRTPECTGTGTPDARTYVLEVDDGTQRRTLRVPEPVADPALAALIAAVRRHGRG